MLEVWKQPHTPKDWMKNSCLWYSQIITKELGIEKFRDYVTQFDYGNHEILGDKGKNNGLTNA
ncbi:penicillin-binding transpeptidase domain-containing protein [Rickettsia australis]|uniref:penicillin-binding transpeptidase domain-containing protein n=1 Tax=Rickettsia australis TaxID=787 RepID=UPI0002EB8A08|nr:penicillin-binding transpeptidase domain-containing protein [Rickettsia australis]